MHRRCSSSCATSRSVSHWTVDSLVELTSKVIQLIGSSFGISVFFTSSSVSFSSSNATVMITPGGVQVPIIRWCFILAVLSNNSNSSNNSPASLQTLARNFGSGDNLSSRKFHSHQLSRSVIRAGPLPSPSSEPQQRGAKMEESWIK